MSKDRKAKPRDEAAIKGSVVRSSNVASAINTGGSGRTSVSSRQRIVQRNGKTVRITERHEERSDP